MCFCLAGANFSELNPIVPVNRQDPTTQLRPNEPYGPAIIGVVALAVCVFDLLVFWRCYADIDREQIRPRMITLLAIKATYLGISFTYMLVSVFDAVSKLEGYEALAGLPAGGLGMLAARRSLH